MSEPLNRHAVRIWTDAVTDVLADARRSLDPIEFRAVVDIVVMLIARHRQQEMEALEGLRPLEPAMRAVGPRVVIEIPLESTPRLRFEGTSRDEIARLREWISSRYDLIHLIDEAHNLARNGS